jgi:hypothetical protein
MNENDIERELLKQPLARYSTALDRRMEALFDEAQSQRPHFLMRAVPVWLTVAACLICTVAGFGARSLFTSPQHPPTVVYFFPPNEEMTRFLTGARANRNDSFDFSRARIEVIQPPAPQGNQL